MHWYNGKKGFNIFILLRDLFFVPCHLMILKIIGMNISAAFVTSWMSRLVQGINQLMFHDILWCKFSYVLFHVVFSMCHVIIWINIFICQPVIHFGWSTREQWTVNLQKRKKQSEIWLRILNWPFYHWSLAPHEKRIR